MENNGRRLGWIAIAIGVVALIVALTGRAGSFGGGRYAASQYGQNYAQPYQNNPNVAPQAPVAPQGRVGPQDRVGPRGNVGPTMREHGQAVRGGPGAAHRQGGWFGFLFWPFRLLGWLLKLLFWGLLIFLVIKLFQRRGWGGPGGGWRGPWNRGPEGPRDQPTQPNQQTPPSEQPPYTGETQSF